MISRVSSARKARAAALFGVRPTNAAMMSKSGSGAVADDAFLAGVLHDVGELVLATRRPEWLRDAAAHAALHGIPLHGAEVALFGTSHAEVGAYLVGLWGLPFRIVEAVACHHTPARVGHGGVVDAVAAVHIADALVAETAQGRGAGVSPSAPFLSYIESLGLAERCDEWRAMAAAVG